MDNYRKDGGVMTDSTSKNALEPKLPPYTNWGIVVSEAPEDGAGPMAWESVVKVTADEIAPDGRVFSRDIATFTPTDHAMDYARAFINAVTHPLIFVGNCGVISDEEAARVRSEWKRKHDGH